jgi:hypothetical protein
MQYSSIPLIRHFPSDNDHSLVRPDFRCVGGFLWVLWFPPPIKLTATTKLKYCWKWCNTITLMYWYYFIIFFFFLYRDRWLCFKRPSARNKWGKRKKNVLSIFFYCNKNLNNVISVAIYSFLHSCQWKCQFKLFVFPEFWRYCCPAYAMKKLAFYEGWPLLNGEI